MLTIQIDNPSLTNAIKAQADELGIPVTALAESAIADRLGFPKIAGRLTKAITGLNQLSMGYPAVLAIPRPQGANN